MIKFSSLDQEVLRIFNKEDVAPMSRDIEEADTIFRDEENGIESFLIIGGLF